MYKVYCDDYLIYDTQLEDLKIISPKLDLELNKTGTFSFKIYPEHPHYDKLQKLKSIIQVFQDNYLIFRGRILNDEQGFYNEKTVSCEGELAFLLDSVQRPYDFQSGENHTDIKEFFTFLINNHNAQVDKVHQFKVGNVTVTDPNNYIVRSDTTYLNTFDSITQKLINTNGGYLYVRHEKDGNYIDYLEDFSTLSNQTVEFGSNLVEIKQSQTGEDIATAIIPLGAKAEDSETRLTIESVNDGKDYVFDEDAVEKYGWIFATVQYDDVTTADALKRKAEEYLAQRVLFGNTIELTAVDLHALNTDISAFKLGDYIKVQTKPHSVEGLFLVNKLSINLLSPSSNKLTLGATFSSITDQTNAATSGTNSTIQQIKQDIINVTNTNSEFQELSKYIKIQNGNIIFGKNGNEITLQIQNDRILFVQNGITVAYFANNKFFVISGEYTNSLKVGNFIFTQQENGNLSFEKAV